QSNFGTISPFFPMLGKTRTDLPIEQAAQIFHNDVSRIERIPLGLLGLGTDGHTASLFNLQDAALRDARLTIPVIKTEKPDRISVTPTLLHKVEKILILATGADKKEMIQTLLKKPETIPAGVALADHPNVEIWTDQTN
ncbi:MAG: 6-phosphogluconolactonase, partial [Kiritimatiellales bacterium]|nr:6-phosphogluconolactonase [Kiritimatiellales bacterium]